MLLDVFPLQLLIFFLCSIYSVFLLLFNFRSNLFGVLYACCIFIGISFLRAGKFSSMILLRIFSVPLSWDSYSSFIPVIVEFGLFIVSQIYCMLFARSFFFFLISYILFA